MSHPNPTTPVTDAPKLTATGYQKGTIDPALHTALIQWLRLHKPEDESVPDFIGADNKPHVASTLSDLSNPLKHRVHQSFKSVCEDWIKHQYVLIPTFVYGVRTYNDGAWLKQHRDRIGTHIVSVILQVEQKVRKDWPLYLENANGEWDQVFLRPGEYVLYEGRRLEHGRLDPLDGESFSNVFCHYKLGQKR
jgi:prolyl 4-hydroxylase